MAAKLMEFGNRAFCCDKFLFNKQIIIMGFAIKQKDLLLFDLLALFCSRFLITPTGQISCTYLIQKLQKLADVKHI